MKRSILVPPDLFFFLKIPLAMWHLFCSYTCFLDACFLEEQRHGDFDGDCVDLETGFDDVSMHAIFILPGRAFVKMESVFMF